MDTHAFQSGIAVIITIKEFDSSLYILNRNENDVDISSLSNRFDDLGFETIICSDLTVKEITETFNEIKERKEDLTKIDCLLIAVLSYGEKELIYAKDNFIKIKTVVEQFSSEHCPELTSTPKIFIFQASKLRKKEDPNQADAKGLPSEDKDDEEINASHNLRETEKGPYSDKSEYFAGVPKESLIVVTRSDINQGKTFSRILANAFENVKTGEDIETLFNGIRTVLNDMVMDGYLQKKLVLKPK